MGKRELEQIREVRSSINPNLPLVKDFVKIDNYLWTTISSELIKVMPRLWLGLPGNSDRRLYVR